jgi:hypothetical protein
LPGQFYTLFAFFFILWVLTLWIFFFLDWTKYYLDVWYVTQKRIIIIDQKALFDREISNVRFDKIQDVLGFCVKYNVTDGIKEVKKALESGLLNPDDPTCYTLQWYKSLIEWDVRLKSLSIDGQII